MWGAVQRGMRPHRTGRESLAAVLQAAETQRNSSELVHLEDVAITGQLREKAGVNLVDAHRFILTHPARAERDGWKGKVVICLQGRQGLVARVWKNLWGRMFRNHSIMISDAT